MAWFELTDKIWYGNMDAPVQAKGKYKAILDLAEGYTDPPYHYSLSALDKKMDVFRMPITEDELATPEWIGKLQTFRFFVAYNNLYPLLVHCFAGQCRAPITAVYFAWDEGGRYSTDLTCLLMQMRELGKTHGVDEKRRYHASLQEYMRQNSR